MKLSVLIPVYNEIKTLPDILNQIIALDIDKELILVDDCSKDGSRQLMEREYKGRPRVKVIFHERNMGKGSAIRTALKEASGEYAIIQDADLEYDPRDYIHLLKTAEREKAEVVYGSRFMKTWRATSLPHYLVNGFLTAVTNILFNAKLTDMETCYKLIKTDLFRSLDIKSRRFEIEPEITAKLLKKGYKIIEVPVSYMGRTYHEGKKITWKDGLHTLWMLFKYRFIN
ncbi:MAG: glycosyltransferase family 2 protein [Candidatus Omnitrophota bacterium]